MEIIADKIEYLLPKSKIDIFSLFALFKAKILVDGAAKTPKYSVIGCSVSNKLTLIVLFVLFVLRPC